jgi:predicted anti-sigma-YlaC factor YlaD
MDCDHAQDLVLDELDGTLDEAVRHRLRGHLEGCGPCQAFAALQRRLDRELEERAPAVALDAGFRRALDRRLAAGQAWPEWLPELAYVVGAVLATGASVLAVPLPLSSTWWIGGALAGVGLLVHSLAAGALSVADAREVSDLR